MSGHILCSLGLLVVLPVGATTLSVRIFDENDRSTPARVYLTDGAGRLYAPENAIIYKRLPGDMAEEHFVPKNGSFQVELAPGKYHLTIERRKEYLPISEDLEIIVQILPWRGRHGQPGGR